MSNYSFTMQVQQQVEVQQQQVEEEADDQEQSDSESTTAVTVDLQALTQAQAQEDAATIVETATVVVGIVRKHIRKCPLGCCQNSVSCPNDLMALANGTQRPCACGEKHCPDYNRRG